MSFFVSQELTSCMKLAKEFKGSKPGARKVTEVMSLCANLYMAIILVAACYVYRWVVMFTSCVYLHLSMEKEYIWSEPV